MEKIGLALNTAPPNLALPILDLPSFSSSPHSRPALAPRCHAACAKSAACSMATAHHLLHSRPRRILVLTLA